MKLTDAELEAIQSLPRETPYQIHGVSQTQLSIARHSGGCRFNGAKYTYDYSDDSLTRNDVVRKVRSMRRKVKVTPVSAQGVLDVAAGVDGG